MQNGLKMEDKLIAGSIPQAPAGEFVKFRCQDGKEHNGSRFGAETFWLSQAMLCDLFYMTDSTSSEHIKHIFGEVACDDSCQVRQKRVRDAGSLIKQINVPVIIDHSGNRAHNLYTTHPLWRHSVDCHLGRKNRPKGGFFICKSINYGRCGK